MFSITSGRSSAFPVFKSCDMPFGYAPTTLKPAELCSFLWPTPAGMTTTSPFSTSTLSPFSPPNVIEADPLITPSASCVLL